MDIQQDTVDIVAKYHTSPSQFDNPQGALFKLTQTTTNKEYQCQFQNHSDRVVSLPHNFLLSCFISGLKPHIRREVQALQLLSLMHAIDLEKISRR